MARPTWMARLASMVWMELGDQGQGGLVAGPDCALQFAGLLA